MAGLYSLGLGPLYGEATMTIKVNDIRKLLQAVYKPVTTSPGFKGRLLGHLLSKVARREVKQ